MLEETPMMDESDNDAPSGPITRSRMRRAPVVRRGRSAKLAEITPTASTPVGRNIKKKKLFEEKTPISQDIGTLTSNTRLQIKINKVHVTAEWKWKNVGDDTCGICRSAFEASCVNCKMPGDDCPLVMGGCKHAFHMHCILKWTESQNTPRPQCPLCRQEWKYNVNASSSS